MDEYIMFHRLACWDKIQTLNNFQDGCYKPELALRLPGITYFRSFGYGGIASSIAQAPFQAIWDSLATTRWVGVLALFLSSLGIAASFKLQKEALWIPVIWFPIAYSLIHDGGPVRISFLTVCWTPYFIQQYLNRPRRSIRLGAAVAVVLLWLIATEDKPFFMYLIPGLTVYSYTCLRQGDELISRERNQRFALLVTVATLTAFSFLAIAHVGHVPYLHYLSSQVNVNRWSSFDHSLRLLIDFPENAERILQDGSQIRRIGSAASIILFALLLAWQIKDWTRADQITNRLTRGLLASAALFWLFGWIAGGRFHHHFVFAQAPIAAILAFTWQRKDRHSIMGIFAIAALCIVSLATVSAAPKNTYYSSSAFQHILQEGIRASRSPTIINCSSWGCYFSHSLADNDQHPVVWAQNENDMLELARIAMTKKSEILHVCYQCNLQDVQKLYSPFRLINRLSSNGWLVARFTQTNADGGVIQPTTSTSF